ncbi:MAG: DJ-1/PfpI family protein [Sarcina sp.]
MSKGLEDLEGKIAIFLFDGITDYEVTFIAHLLSVDAGKEIVTVSYEDKLIKSSSGLIYKTDKFVSEILDEEIDGLIISGGWFGELRRELYSLINKLNLKKKHVPVINRSEIT